jgi:hypothetical protein
MEHGFYVTLRDAATNGGELHGYVLYCKTGETADVSTFEDVRRFIQTVVERSDAPSDGHAPPL